MVRVQSKHSSTRRQKSLTEKVRVHSIASWSIAQRLPEEWGYARTAASCHPGFSGPTGLAGTPAAAADGRPAAGPPGLHPAGPGGRPLRRGRGTAAGSEPPDRPAVAGPL